MKHLKRFNEANDPNFENELLSYLEGELANYFSYLKDYGYNIIINAYEDKSLFFYGNKNFYWSDISSDFIPFLIMLNYRNEIDSIRIVKSGQYWGDIEKYSNVISENFNFTSKIASITIYLK